MLAQLVPHNLYDLGIILGICALLVIAFAILFSPIRRTICFDLRMPVRATPVLLLAGLGSLIGGLIGIYGFFVEPNLITIKQVSFDVPQVFLAQPIRVVVIGDLQYRITTAPESLGDLVKQINSQDPDLVLWVGDLVEYDDSELVNATPLKLINARYGKYAVLGNHDYGAKAKFGEMGDENIATAVSKFWDESGFVVLRNTTEVANVGGTTVGLTGLDSMWVGRSNVEEAIANRPNTNFNLLLAHEPDAVLKLKQDQNFALILAGHCHGGQVNLGVLNSLFRLPILPPGCRQSNPPSSEIFTLNNQKLLVTKGVGHSFIRFRLGAIPEIILLELK